VMTARNGTTSDRNESPTIAKTMTSVTTIATGSS
jgi:hypothetical protein